MSRRERWAFWVSLGVMIGAGLLTSPAQAFERSVVPSAPGTPLFWAFRSVAIYHAASTSLDLSPGQAAAAAERSIRTWNDAGRECSDFRLRLLGEPATTGTTLLRGRHDGENRIVWREGDWPPEVSNFVLAQTTTVFNRHTGQILDADIDINGLHHLWTDTDDPSLANTDFENTLTHELGHLLGLGHVLDLDATMYGDSPPGDLAKRSLADDDIAGLCFTYPTGFNSPDTPILPGTPLTSTCSIGRPTGARSPLSIVLLFALGAFVWGRRRSRSGARAPRSNR